MENFAKEIKGILKVEAELEENDLLEEELLVVLGADALHVDVAALGLLRPVPGVVADGVEVVRVGDRVVYPDAVGIGAVHHTIGVIVLPV